MSLHHNSKVVMRVEDNALLSNTPPQVIASWKTWAFAQWYFF